MALICIGFFFNLHETGLKLVSTILGLKLVADQNKAMNQMKKKLQTKSNKPTNQTNSSGKKMTNLI